MALRVTLSAAYHLPVLVSYSVDVIGTTATRGSDYTVTEGTLTFDTGDTEEQISLVILPDKLDEDNEQVIIRLTPLSNAVSAGGDVGNVTIIDSNIAPTVRFATAAQSIAENIGSTTFTLELSEASALPVAVPYTVGGSASFGNAAAGSGDHSLRNGVLVIPAGAKSVRLRVTIIDDQIDEDEEEIVIKLGTPLNADVINPSSHTITITDNDATGVRLNRGALALSEGGRDTYTVALASEPTSIVTVTVQPDPQVRTDQGTLIFTPLNWSRAQTVTVTAFDDLVDETATHRGFVAHQVRSGDARYDQFEQTATLTVTVTITDNDTAGVSVGPVSLALTESPTGLQHTRTYTVALTSQPTTPVTVTALPDAQAIVSPATLVFDAVNWRGPLTVTVTAIDDDYDEISPHTGLITHTVTSADPFYAALPAARRPNNISLTIDDNDTFGISISPGVLALREGAPGPNTGTYTVTLNSRPTAPVTLTLTVTDTAQLSVAPTQLVFGTDAQSWKTPQVVTVTAAQDQIDEGPDDIAHTLTVSHTATSGDAAYNGLVGPPKQVAITDADTADIVIAAVPTIPEGSSTTYTVRLSSQPAGDVNLNLVLNPTGVITITPTTMLFTAANWQTPVPVTVDAADNARLDGDRPVTVTHSIGVSGDPIYRAVAPRRLDLTVVDDDAAGVVFSGPLTLEEGTSEAYDIVLRAEPTANVTLTLAVSPTLEADLAQVVFTPGTWNISQTVTITASDNMVMSGDRDLAVAHTVSSSDPSFNALGTLALGVRVVENDNANLAVAPGSLALSEATGAAQGTFDVALTSEPESPVRVTFTPDAQTTINPAELIFTAANYSQTQVVTVTAKDDQIAETTPHRGTITLSSSSLDRFYNAAWPDLDIQIDDNDTAGIGVLAPASLLTSESGLTSTLQIWLTSEPTAPVTVSVVSSDLTEATISAEPPGTLPLVFNKLNWNTPVTVTVAGVDDGDADGLQPYTVLISDAVSGDAFYNGLAADLPAIAMENLDDEPAMAVLSDTIASPEGDTGTRVISFPVTLTRASSVTVTVSYETYDLTAAGGDDYAVSTGVITFTPGMTTSTIPVIIYGDTAYEANELVGARLTAITAIGDAVQIKDGLAKQLITNDDPPGVHTAVGELVTPEAAGPVTLTVWLDEPQPIAVRVEYRTVAGTARAGADFLETSGVLTFAAGEITQTLSIMLQNDGLVEELYETFRVELLNPTGTILASPSTTTLTIVDDEQTLPLETQLFLVTGGPLAPPTNGYSYTDDTSGYGYVIFAVPCTWPATRPLTLELWSAGMYKESSRDLAGLDTIRGNTEFELYDLGPAGAGASLTPTRGAGMLLASIAPAAETATEDWEVLHRIAAPTPCGLYALRAAAQGDDENYWAVRAGFATDADPETALDPLVPGGSASITAAALHTTTEHRNTNTASTMWFFVPPGTASLVLRTYDLDYGTSGTPQDAGARVTYYEPSAQYDPSGASGGQVGEASGSSWGEDRVDHPRSGWWRAVVHTTQAENAYILDASGDGRPLPLHYEPPAIPKLALELTPRQPETPAGSSIGYTLTYSNTGIVSVVEPVLTLQLPEQLTFDGDPCRSMSGCAWSNSGTLTLTPSWLAPGVTASVAVDVTLVPGAVGTATVGFYANYTDERGYRSSSSTTAIVILP